MACTWQWVLPFLLIGVGALDVQPRPNFLILFADDMGYGDTSGSGHPTINTPNLDRMAAEGMRFTQWYSGFHVCSPSRASMLTGRLPIRSGTAGKGWTGGVFPFDAIGGLPQNETTFATLVRDAGYATLAIGKWHVGQQEKFLPTSHGFDEYFGLPFSVDESSSAWDKKDGNGILPLLHNTTVIEQPVNLNTLETRYVQKASEFIHANAKAQKPFLVYLAWSHVHVPDFVAPPFCNKSARGRFGDAMEEMDSHIGSVLAVLKDAGVDHNTLIFFTSDNGPWMIQRLSAGSAGTFFEGKSTTWEGGIREPAIVRWPGKVQAGTINREMVATYDIFATVVKLSGAKLPEDRVIDGKDLTGVLTQGAKGHRCLFHYKGTPSTGLPPKADDPQPGLWAIRCGAFKAHYVTNCAVMQMWGDARCGPSSVDAFATFQACHKENTFDVCALQASSTPIIHNPPILYNVDHDPSEMYQVSQASDDYKTAMAEITQAKKVHEATLVPVPNQMDLGGDPKLQVCCRAYSEKTDCVCQPENWAPAEGVCSPVYDPTMVKSQRAQQSFAV